MGIVNVLAQFSTIEKPESSNSSLIHIGKISRAILALLRALAHTESTENPAKIKNIEAEAEKYFLLLLTTQETVTIPANKAAYGDTKSNAKIVVSAAGITTKSPILKAISKHVIDMIEIRPRTTTVSYS